jgi:4-amino-4-deoxy-L-arabinose transferase-like glycosyltransferase
MRAPGRGFPRLLLVTAGWVLVCWVVFGWRLGYPSFWDPDEATYAETTREMLAEGNWLVPTYDGQPFFDKPPLFYVLQMASFTLLGPTELAARVVPALSAVALVFVVAWFGVRLFNRDVGHNGALMFAVLPATFALSSYAIVDMTFTLFLFSGCALVAVSALDNRPRWQYVGYVFIAAAVLTKGPLALILAGLAFLIAVAIASEARAPLLRLRWGVGLLMVAVLSAPWFIFMWRRFGDAFVTGYVLKENLWLFSGSLYGSQRSILFYPKVILVGLLPWTPLLLGRLVDAARGLRITTAERLLWSWAVAVVGFFTISGFKLDHYVFPAAPALCLLCAVAWNDARSTAQRSVGVLCGLVAIPIVLFASGIVLIPGLNRVPLELPAAARLLPIALLASGIAMMGQVARDWRPSSLPFAAVAGLLVSYALILTIGLPAFEQMKPTRRLARIVAATAEAEDHVGMYRLNRWSSSWRFYVGRHSDRLETTEDLRMFFARPGRHYCAMLRRDYDGLATEGFRLRIVHQEIGLFTTTGRALRAGTAARHDIFIVVTEDPLVPTLDPVPLPY